MGIHRVAQSLMLSVFGEPLLSRWRLELTLFDLYYLLLARFSVKDTSASLELPLLGI